MISGNKHLFHVLPFNEVKQTVLLDKNCVLFITQAAFLYAKHRIDNEQFLIDHFEVSFKKKNYTLIFFIHLET